MTALNYVFCVRNSTTGGTPVLGLTPGFSSFVNLATLSSVTPPTVHELAVGQYYFAWDVDANGEISYQVDCGSSLTVAFDRYKDGECTQADPLRAADISAVVSQLLNALLSGYTETGSVGVALNKLLALALDGSGDVTPTTTWTTGLLTAILGELPTLTAITDAILADPTHPIVTDGAGNVSISAATETAIADALLDLANGVEAGLTMRQALRVMAAILAGVAANLSVNNWTFAAAGNPGTPRVASTTDSTGQRTEVTLTP